MTPLTDWHREMAEKIAQAHPLEAVEGMRSNKAAHAMAAEYEAWIRFYHAGMGDYADFLRKRLSDEDAHSASDQPKEQSHG